MTAYEQRSYAGAAADTLLNADITNSATSFSVTPGSGTGYPDGSGGPFFVIIDWDNSKAEKVRCSGRVNDTFTVAGSGGGRGQDGTSAFAHTANAKVRAVITATDLQEANRAAANTVGKVTTKGDLLAGTGANALARVAAGTDGQVVLYDSTQAAGIRPGTLDYAGAWTAYTPTWTSDATSPTIGNGSISGRYKQVGKTITYVARITIGSTTTLGSGSFYRVSLPVTPFAFAPVGQAFANGTGGNASGVHYYDGAFAFIYGIAVASGLLVSGEVLTVAGSYEAA